MKKLLAVVCFIIFVFSVFPVCAQQTTQSVVIYVSPYGDDNSDGTKKNPLHTVYEAQKKVRNLAENMQSDIVVNLKGGTYFLDKPIIMNESDSGKNGYHITWQSNPGEEAVISGGVEISGWEQHDGDIWKIKTPKQFLGRYISNVYIGDRIATFSRIEDKYFVGEIKSENDIRTATFNKDDVPFGPKMDDALLFWDYNWRHYMWPVNNVTTDVDGNTVFKMIPGIPTYSIDTMYTPPSWNFIVANTYTFLDRPGEFYYDRKNGVIYYFKAEDEDLNSEKTIIPYLEYLWRIEGETTEKAVENISFKGITFSHSMCQRNYKYGMYVNQALEGYMKYTDEIMWDVGARMLNRGAVEVLNARNVNFEGNSFKNLDNIGLAMYTGVFDSNVQGNLFSDLSDTGFLIGESYADMAEKEKYFGMTDISERKKVTYSEPYRLWSKKSRRLTAQGGNYVLIDFEDKYSISKVYLKLETAMSKSDVIEIQASNAESFAAYEILSKIYPKDSEWQIGENEYAVDVGDPSKYRYIRIKNKTGPMQLVEHRVYTNDFDGGARGAVCENISFTDNLLTRTVREFWSSVPIHVFHAKNINISYNEIDGCPYSGITFGWAWNDDHIDLSGNKIDMPGNKINYNRIKNTMQRNHDGAGIYVLGRHTDSQMKGNYITGCINGMGGIYPDEGSCYWVIEENIMEEVNISLHPWSSNQHDITMKNNYTTAPYYVIGAKKSTMENTELFIRKNMPSHIREKANLAGIRVEYAYLQEKRGEGEVPYKPILIDGYPAPQCYAPHYFWNEAFSYLHAELSEADNMLKTAKISNLINGYEKEYLDFEKFVLDAKIILNGEFERDLYYQTVRLLKKEIDEFASCGIFDGKEYVQSYQNFGITGKSETGGNTLISTSKSVYTDFIVDDYDFLNVGAGTSVFRNAEKNQFKMKNSDANVTYFTANKFKNAVFEGKMSFEAGHKDDWQGIILRANNTSGTPGRSDYSCYIIDFPEYGIEVQRFNEGKRTLFYGKINNVNTIYDETLSYGNWKRSDLSDIRIGTLNEDNGVRIFLEANGEMIFSILDDAPEALYDGGYFGLVTPDGTITIEKKSETSNEYFDLSGYEWAKTAVYQLSYRGVINGTSENSFSPEKVITRAQFSKILAGIFNLKGTSSSFSDISSNEWYYEAVCGLEKNGVFEDIYTKEFYPDKPILREEMAAIALKALKASGMKKTSIPTSFKDSAEISDNLRDLVSEYAGMGLISGMEDGTFQPKKEATRAQAAVMLYNLYSTLEE